MDNGPREWLWCGTGEDTCVVWGSEGCAHSTDLKPRWRTQSLLYYHGEHPQCNNISEWPLPSTTRKPNAKQSCPAVAEGRSAHVMGKGSQAPRLASKAFWHASHQDMLVVPYVRLQTHFLMEKPCFPCIPESGEPRAAERISALCNGVLGVQRPRLVHALLAFLLQKFSPGLFLFAFLYNSGCFPYLKEPQSKMLKTYISGSLLKRDSGTYCATLVSPPCPVFCNVWVLTTSPAICAGSLCLLGFCSESSTAIAHYPKTQLLSVTWFTFPPFSF